MLNVVTHSNDVIVKARVAICASTVAAFDHEAIGFHETNKTFPEPVWSGSVQLLGDDVGQRLALRLRHVENMNHPKATQFTVRRVLRSYRLIGRLATFALFTVASSVQAGSEDRDPLLAPADVTVE
jgi:hypothetical protein